MLTHCLQLIFDIVLTNVELWCIIYNCEQTGLTNNLVAAMAQLVEHILGKDEVTGSSPVSSSKRQVFTCLFVLSKLS